jgi:hypothetical protein
VAIGARFVLADTKKVIVEAGAFVSYTDIIVSEVAMSHQRFRGSVREFYDQWRGDGTYVV